MFSIAFGRDTFTMWIAIIMFAYFVFDALMEGGKIWYDRSYFWLGCFLSVYLVSVTGFALVETSVSWLGRTPLDRAATTSLRLLYVVSLFIVCSSFLANSPRDFLWRVLQVQLILGAILASFAILQYVSVVVFGFYGFSEIVPSNESFSEKSSFMRLGTEKIYRATSIFNEPAWLGFFLVPLLAKIIVAKIVGEKIVSKFVDSSLLAILFLSILVNFTLTSLLSLSIVGFLYALSAFWRKKHKNFLWIILILVSASTVLFVFAGDTIIARFTRVIEFKDLSTLDRLFRVYTGMKVFLENFWIGVGPGGYAFHYPRLGGWETTIMASPLNIWLSFLTDVGIVGFIPFIGFLFSILRRLNRQRMSDPMAEIYWWGIVGYLVVLSTTDFWVGELMWIELAIALTLVVSTHPSFIPLRSVAR